jgi:hypothetical protein
VPSEGLSLAELTAIFERLDLPSIVYRSGEKGRPPGLTGIESVAQCYLASGLPVLAAGGSHIAVLVGYEEVDRQATYFVQDDAQGPLRRWQGARIYKPNRRGEVEDAGAVRDRWVGVAARHDADADEFAQRVAGLQDQSIRLQVVAVRSSVYKQALDRRGYPDPLARSLKLLPMPRWVWVAEAL